MTDLQTIQAGWDHAARQDAMWNILTDPERIGGGWDEGAFFAHGRAEIDAAIQRLQSIPHATCRALDFGCGVGRLTEALARHYDRVDGVDLSEEMVSQARALSSSQRTHYHHNPAPNLSLFESGTFDLVYSMIVLQHMPQELQRGYVAEFFRVLKPGGVAMFEIPDCHDSQHPNSWLSMYGVSRATVEEWIAASDGRLVDVESIGGYRYTSIARAAGCES